MVIIIFFLLLRLLNSLTIINFIRFPVRIRELEPVQVPIIVILSISDSARTTFVKGDLKGTTIYMRSNASTVHLWINVCYNFKCVFISFKLRWFGPAENSPRTNHIHLFSLKKNITKSHRHFCMVYIVLEVNKYISLYFIARSPGIINYSNNNSTVLWKLIVTNTRKSQSAVVRDL